MLRLSLTCVVVVAAFVSSASAQELKPIKLALTPAKPPTPALRFQLLPDARVAINGDAAPVYKQVIELLAKKSYKQQMELFDRWSSQALDQLPKDEMRKVLAEYDDVCERLDKAARYDHCDWGLLARVRAKGIGFLMEDIQQMRSCAQLLTIRARLEMAEGRPDKALLTLRTGFALARHVGETENTISFLVGVAIASLMNEQLDQFLAQPDAPNLYYALTDLPTPLISVRKALQGERIMICATFPGLLEAGTNLDAGNMSLQDLSACGDMFGTSNYWDRLKQAQDILHKHDAAKEALVAAGRPRDKVEAMPHLQVALLHALLEYDTTLDQMIVWQQLPYWEMTQRLPARKDDLSAVRRRDANAAALPLAPLFLSSLDRVLMARARTDRKIALLRTIEALRFYAAMHDGRLPPSLAAVKEVPIPLDPVTGKDFEFRLDDDTATLCAPTPPKEMPNAANTVVYELRMRN